MDIYAARWLDWRHHERQIKGQIVFVDVCPAMREIETSSIIWEKGKSVCPQSELFLLMNDKPPQDHRLQKLDKDFIGNWITYLFYTYFINDTGFLHCSFFANITASCQQKKPKRQPKATERWGWNMRLFQSSTLNCFSGISEHKWFLMQTNKGFLKTKHTFRTNTKE